MTVKKRVAVIARSKNHYKMKNTAKYAENNFL